jgi:hypothetical protein
MMLLVHPFAARRRPSAPPHAADPNPQALQLLAARRAGARPPPDPRLDVNCYGRTPAQVAASTGAPRALVALLSPGVPLERVLDAPALLRCAAGGGGTLTLGQGADP